MNRNKIIKQAVLYPLVLFICFIIFSSLTAFLYSTARRWIGTFMLCMALVLLEGFLLLSGAGWNQLFFRNRETTNRKQFAKRHSVVRILYFSISFFIIFFVFPFAFVKSYMMAQVMIFLCGDVCSVAFIIVVLFNMKYTELGFASPLFRCIKAGHLICLFLLLTAVVSFNITGYNPAFFHKTYKGYISNSTVADIHKGDIINIRFSYQTYTLLNETMYKMRLTVKKDSRLLFGKFGHGMVFGTMSKGAGNFLTIDVSDPDPDDGDPAVTLKTKEGIFTYYSIDKYKGNLLAFIDD